MFDIVIHYCIIHHISQDKRQRRTFQLIRLVDKLLCSIREVRTERDKLSS
ncbi:hypothetical protein VP177E371_P0076 [Vibrio phage 177E37-1]|nr:hypothetical protein VP177E371_P0076 [Vibrio phage 177E37-1]